MDITLKDAQEQVDNWIKTVGVRYFSELTNLGILMEEVGELSRLMVRTYGEQSFKESDKGKDLADDTGLDPNEVKYYKSKGRLHPAIENKLLSDEMADVLWVLICLANQTGVDLTAALQKNFEKKNIRDAERHKNNEKLGGEVAEK
jgi:NTP pyrophosphatase (non-canonical NTP hydrolase)